MKIPGRLLGAVLLAGACNAHAAGLSDMGGRDYAMPVTSIKAARMQRTLLQQYDFSCGSAALATLLTHHYNFRITEREIFEEMFQRGDQAKIRREGFSLLDMKRFLETRGFTADGFEQPLDKLLEAKIPAIVLVNENGYHHFVVVKGLERDRVLIGDPASGTRAMPRAGFDAIWKNKLLFVIHNKMELARFNQPEDWRVAPRAPLRAGIGVEGLTGSVLPKLGPSDF
jgi:predicted double-glycine peptidase